jgi:vacuolar protein sorting-associated protein 72
MEYVDPGAQSDASESSNGSSSDSSNAVETLIAGRQRRVNAGNRMSALVQEEEDKQEEADEVTLLFAEEEDEVDEDFDSEQDDDGGDELSSSDDENEGQTGQADELEGEKILRNQEKAEKAKKRKAELALTSGVALRKKVKIDPNVPSKSSQTKTSSKRKERTSWLPKNGDNVRQSSRAHTQLQTSSTKVKLKEDEIRSAKIREQREKKERERQRENPQREVTQADRLAEAARIERRNLKSLNRWEESEKKRAEEQAAKLAALKDRSLSGPVVSWWSGKAKWTGPKLAMVGNKEITHVSRISTNSDEPKKRGRPPKSCSDQQGAFREADMGVSSLGNPRNRSTTPAPSDPAATPAPDAIDVPAPENEDNGTTTAPPEKPAVSILQLPENSFLQGIHDYASMQGQTSVSDMRNLPHLAPSLLAQEAPISQASPEPVAIENSTRNLVILDKFDDLSSDGRKDFQFFYNKKSAKLAKPDREMCPITSSQARFRDPSSGIPYANSFAFKKLQELKKHQYTWSSMLDCVVGKTGVVARGVPESFLGTGVPMRDIQGQPYIRPQSYQLPQPPQPAPPSQSAQPSAIA